MEVFLNNNHYLNPMCTCLRQGWDSHWVIHEKLGAYFADGSILSQIVSFCCKAVLYHEKFTHGDEDCKFPTSLGKIF